MLSTIHVRERLHIEYCSSAAWRREDARAPLFDAAHSSTSAELGWMQDGVSLLDSPRSMKHPPRSAGSALVWYRYGLGCGRVQGVECVEEAAGQSQQARKQASSGERLARVVQPAVVQ
jgi:hypothetical protein